MGELKRKGTPTIHPRFLGSTSNPCLDCLQHYPKVFVSIYLHTVSPQVAEALPRYLYELRPPELASLCRAFAEASTVAVASECGHGGGGWMAFCKLHGVVGM